VYWALVVAGGPPPGVVGAVCVSRFVSLRLFQWLFLGDKEPLRFCHRAGAVRRLFSSVIAVTFAF
jgi:hypothetical protein